MKKTPHFVRVALWLFLWTLPLAAQDFQKIADGVEHARLVRPLKPAAADGKPASAVINLLRLDLTKVRLDVVHAMDAAIGLEKTSSMATRHGALAAVNGGFFRIDRSIFEGDEVGVLIIDGELLSESHADRAALLISNDKKATRIGIQKFRASFSFLRGKKQSVFSGVNRERKAGELILYTPEFHRTTLTGNDGLEVAVENGKIVKIHDGRGSNRIPANGFILSASGDARRELKALKVGGRIKLKSQLSFPGGISSPFRDLNLLSASSPEDVVGGLPQLIKEGKIEITWEQEKAGKAFVETRHPRTAVARLRDGRFLMMTADGRSEESAGMNLNELAEFLLEMGAVDALNMDGGGSTTMFLDGRVVNKPSDREGERRVGDAILVTRR